MRKVLAAGETAIVVRRNNFDEELQKELDHMSKQQKKGTLCIDDEWRGPDISSTRVRSAIKSGDWTAVDSMLPNGVGAYLREYYLRVGLSSTTSLLN